jgi:hypothetical protein
MRKDETEDRVDENGIGNPLVSIHENRKIVPSKIIATNIIGQVHRMASTGGGVSSRESLHTQKTFHYS